MSLLNSDAFVKQVDVRLAQTLLLLVIFPDQCRHVQVSIVALVLVNVVPLAHNAANGRDAFDVVLALLAAVLIAHCFS